MSLHRVQLAEVVQLAMGSSLRAWAVAGMGGRPGSAEPRPVCAASPQFLKQVVDLLWVVQCSWRSEVRADAASPLNTRGRSRAH